MIRARRLVPLCTAVFFALFLTACQVDFRVDLVVADDGSGTVTVGVGLDEEAMDRVPDLADQLRADDLEAAGWTVSGLEKEEDGVTWVRASKPFANPDEAVAIIDEIAGPEGPFRDVELTRTRSFGETTWSLEGTADFSGGLETFSDEQLAALLDGDSFGGNLQQIEEETGKPAAEQVRVTFATTLPGAEPVITELDPTDDQPQALAVTATSTRWAARAWALVAILAFLALVAVIIFRLVVDARDRKRGSSGSSSPDVDEWIEAEADRPHPPKPEGDEELAVVPVASAGPPVESADVTPTSPKTPRRLGVVVLDGMGVVFDTGSDLDGLLTTFLRDEGHNVTRELVTTQLVEATLGNLTPAELWSSLGVDGNLDEITDQFLALHKPSQGLRAFLERMRDRELPVIVVANDVAEWSNKLRDTHKLSDLTAGWIVSGEIGHRLPDAAVYDEIVRASDQDARNIFFIGDELRFLAAARSAGFAAAWFNPDPDPGDENAGYPMIRSFQDFGLGGG